MKLWSTTPVSDSKRRVKLALWIAIGVMVMAIPAQFITTRPTSADQYDSKINSLRRKVSSYEKEAKSLNNKADTLKNALNKIENDKAKIQTEVDLYQAQYDKLVSEIKATEKRIAENRRISGELIVQSSLSDDVPLIVRLASSEDLADYIDGEATRISVRDAIIQKTEENEKLKVKLEDKKVEVKKVLDDVKFKRNQLADKQAEQQRLISRAKNSEKQYRALIKKSENKINDLLRRQQEAAQAALGSGGGSGWALNSTSYPWKNDPTNYNDNCVYPSGIVGADDWGYCVRQCTSYVAWKLAKDGKSGFSGHGHAYNWWWSFSGISASQVKRGDVVVSPAGGYGHVMYIESVSNGQVHYTDYNGAGGPVSPGAGSLPLSTATNGTTYKVIRF